MGMAGNKDGEKKWMKYEHNLQITCITDRFSKTLQ